MIGSISNIPTDYIDYMMGHTISTYNDIRMKGIDYVRNLYSSSGLSIRPKTKITKLERIKMFIEFLGLNPDEILSREALAIPYRTIIDPESRKIEVLNQALKQAIIRGLQDQQKGVFCSSSCGSPGVTSDMLAEYPFRCFEAPL